MLRALGALLLLTLTLVAYVPAMRGGFIWDDDDNVTENVALRTWHGLARIWFDPRSTQQYYPLTHSSFWLQYQIGGLRPFPYHLGNVLLHALGSILLWFVLASLSVPGAWLAAAVFALHPVHVESVAWVTERKNVLAGVFFLAALLAYIRYAGLDTRPPDGRGPSTARSAKRGVYAVALLLALAALLSKTATASLPAVLLAVTWWKKGRLTWRDVAPTIPLFVAGLVLGTMTAWLEKHHVGAAGSTWDLSFADQVILAGRVLCFYAGKLVWPAPLIFIYPRWRIDSTQLGQYLFPVGAAAAMLALLLLHKRIGRGPGAAALAFVLALAPASGFFNVFFMRYSYVQDHFQYFASMAAIALLAALVTLGLRELAARVRPAGILRQAVPVLLLATLGTLTWKQGAIYRDSETLYRNTIARNPEAWMAHKNLGHLLLDDGRMDEAVAHFRAAALLRPEDEELQSNLGVALARSGDPKSANDHLAKVLELHPRSVLAHINFGSVLVDQGALDEARSHFDAALKLDPRSADAHCNLGAVLRLQGRPDEAMARYRQALGLDPDHAGTHINLGRILLQEGRIAEAAAHFTAVLRVDPGSVDAHSNLAQCFWMQGEPEKAIEQYREAQRLRPAHVESANNLAWILATNPNAAWRNSAEAVRLAELACRNTGEKDPGMLDTLAAAYADAGRFEDAGATARRALGLATAAGRRDLALQIQNRLSFYERGQPFRAALPGQQARN